jgi:hypothetical protein
LSKDENFWIRLQVASCFGKDHNNYREDYDHSGILTYTPNNIKLPTTNAWSDISFRCADEPLERLHPIYPWIIGNPDNPYAKEEQQVTRNRPTTPPNENNTWPLARLSFEPPTSKTDWNPLRINFDDPIFLHLNEVNKTWPNHWVVIPENYNDTDWVYLAINSNNLGTGGVFGAHPVCACCSYYENMLTRS